jgi:ElaB/YqjD/DUF883 family membrane-anchored ribosome-binding protein
MAHFSFPGPMRATNVSRSALHHGSQTPSEFLKMASTSSSNYGGQNTVEDLKGKAKQTLDDASDRVREAASDAKQQVQDVAGNVRGAIDKSVKDQPLTTLIMAVAVGFVVGALWKS